MSDSLLDPEALYLVVGRLTLLLAEKGVIAADEIADVSATLAAQAGAAGPPRKRRLRMAADLAAQMADGIRHIERARAGNRPHLKLVDE